MIDIPIETERLQIRRHERTDLDPFLRFMRDDDSTRFLAFSPDQRTESGARAMLEHVMAAYDSPGVVHAYAIVEKGSGDYVGSCGFAPYDDGIVECYYCVNPEHRGRGMAVEATRALIASLAPKVEVRAYCHPENAAAHAVARRCAMTPAGVQRNRTTGLDGETFIYPRAT